MGDRSTNTRRNGAGTGALRHEVELELNEEENGQDQDWR